MNNLLELREAMAGFEKELNKQNEKKPSLMFSMLFNEEAEFLMKNDEEEKEVSFSVFYDFTKEIMHLNFDRFGQTSAKEKREVKKEIILKLLDYLEKNKWDVLIYFDDIWIENDFPSVYNYVNDEKILATGEKSRKIARILEELELVNYYSNQVFYHQNIFSEKLAVRYQMNHQPVVEVHYNFINSSEDLKDAYCIKRLETVEDAKEFKNWVKNNEEERRQLYKKMQEIVENKNINLFLNHRGEYECFSEKGEITIKKTISEAKWVYEVSLFSDLYYFDTVEETLMFFEKEVVVYHNWLKAYFEIMEHIKKKEPYSFYLTRGFLKPRFNEQLLYFSEDYVSMELNYYYKNNKTSSPTYLFKFGKAGEKKYVEENLDELVAKAKKQISQKVAEKRLEMVFEENALKYIPRLLHHYGMIKIHSSKKLDLNKIKTSLHFSEINTELKPYFEEMVDTSLKTKNQYKEKIGNLHIIKLYNDLYIEKDESELPLPLIEN